MNIKPPVGAQINRDHPLASGLIGFWVFNEGGGANVFDYARKNNGTLVNSPTWAADLPGPVLAVSTNQYFRTTNGAISLVPTQLTAHSYVAIVKPTAVSANQAVVSIGEFDDSSFSTALGISSAGNLTWFTDGVGSSVGSGLPVAAGKWQFLALCRTTVDVRFHVDDTQATVASVLNNSIGTDPILVGATASNSATTGFFGGRIAMVMVYNRTLSVSEVQQLYADPYALFWRDEVIGMVPAVGGSTFSDTVAESVTAADSSSAVVTFAASLAETLTAADTQTAVATFSSAVAESGSLAAVQGSNATFVAADAESLTAADSEAVAATFAGTVPESLSASETSNGSVGSTTQSGTVAESVTVTDAQLGSLLALASRAESLAASESASAILIFGGICTETANASDSCAATVISGVSVSESLTPGDSQFAVLPSSPFQIICDGTSLTQGSFLPNPTTDCYPSQLGRRIGSSYTITNLGVGGQRGDQMLSKFAAQVAPLYDATKRQCIIFEMGTNDLAVEGASVDTVQARYLDYYNRCRAVGWPANRIFIRPISPRSGNVLTFTEDNRVLINRWLMLTFPHSCVDPASETRIYGPWVGPHFAAGDIWFLDSVHPTVAGTALDMEAIRKKLVLEGYLPNEYATSVGTRETAAEISNTFSAVMVGNKSKAEFV